MKTKRSWYATGVPIILLIATLIVISIYFAQVKTHSEEDAYDTMQRAIDAQSSKLALTLDSQYAQMETGASAIGLQPGFNPILVCPKLDKIFRKSDNIVYFVADMKGNACRADGWMVIVKDRYYYQEAIAGRRVLEYVENGYISGTPRIVLAVPLKRDGDVIGAIIASVDANYLQTGLDISSLYGGEGFAFLCDEDGRMLVTHGNDALSDVQSIDFYKDAKFSGDASFASLREDIAAGRAGMAAYEIGGRNYLSVYRPLGMNGWTLCCTIPRSVIDPAIQEQAMSGIVLCVVIAVISILLNMLVMREVRRNKRQRDFLAHLYEYLPCGIMQFTHETSPKVISCNATGRRILDYGADFALIGSPMADLLQTADAETFLGVVRRCNETGSAQKYIMPVMKKSGALSYIDCTLEIVSAPDGQIVYQEAFLDATERVKKEKEAEALYIKELERHTQQESGLLFTSCLNLTKDRIVHSNVEADILAQVSSVDEMFQAVIGANYFHEDREWLGAQRARISREGLLNDYAEGRFEFKIKHRHVEDDIILWVVSEFNVRRNPATGDIMAFIYTWDINDEEISRLITQKLVHDEYEYFGQINCETGHRRLFHVDNKRMSHVEVDVAAIFSKMMSEADYRAFEEERTLPTIMERLASQDQYRVYVTLTDEDGVRHDKALTYFYTDPANKLVGIAVADVTDVRREEVERAQVISNALNVAEAASAAKGTFLSQMSHEIRTPLNAVIGYLSLAGEADADMPTIVDYIEKSTIAAKHLLSIINDVLDISAIESGKMKIAREEFDFKHLVTAITTVFYAQAHAKDIQFNVSLMNVTEEWLVGDSLRINQVLMNLLSNAIKFTPAGGLINFTVEQRAIVNDRVQMRMSVQDNGCGMSKEFMSRLFTPFEQQDATTARKHGGSGLGLSITRNLITIMGGQIEVQSEEGVGTTFIVNIAFDRSAQRHIQNAPSDFSRLRALVADDAEQDREYIRNLLKRCGVKCDLVTNGEDAVKQVKRRASSSHPYDLCIVDWQMPGGIDGLETAKQIRAITGHDMPIICATAYDVSSLSRPARDAGINSVIAKPLFQSTMFDILVNLFGGYTPKEVEPTKHVEDMTGMRLILAEDNDMNYDIAMRYLKKVGVEVRRACNGREAVDLYKADPDRYYDAILMDVQMPEMDGYQATREIRASHTEDAASIPIIAMTANAFAEDVTAAVAAGMNDHIAKPIDYDKLYVSLDKYALPRTRARNQVKTEQEETKRASAD